MAFPANALTADEVVVRHLRPHWKAAVRPTFVLLVAVVAVAAAWVLLPDTRGGWIVVLSTMGLAVTIAVRQAVWPLLVWRSTHYVLTNERVLRQTGVATQSRRELPLDRINDHATRQRVGDRLLGCGNLTIIPLGETAPVVFDSVPGVQRLQTTLYELIEADRDRVASDEPEPAPRAG